MSPFLARWFRPRARRFALELGTRRHFTNANAISLSAADGVLMADGTLWSHAATLGTRFKGTEFTIDQSTVENFVRVFTTGSPQKAPVDYDHASTTDDPEVRKLRAQGQVPKAGDVLEMRGVFGPADFTGDLKTAAEKLAASAGRPIDDPRNLGLWIRWKPTARALAAVKAGEYTELSITFDEDWPNNVTGEGQGPTILAVALTNLPFLDDMLPVAASRGDGPSGAGDPRRPTTSQEREMTTKLTMLSVVAALMGKPVTTEDEALTELSGLQPEITGLREYRNVIGAELGETDAAKAAVKIRQLRADLKAAQDAAAAHQETAIATTVENALKEHEKALTVPLREMIGAQLTTELKAGAKLEETKAFKTLKSLTPTGITERRSGADNGEGSAADSLDQKIDAKAKELMTSDAEVKELMNTQGRAAAFRLALVKADKALSTK